MSDHWPKRGTSAWRELSRTESRDECRRVESIIVMILVAAASVAWALLVLAWWGWL